MIDSLPFASLAVLFGLLSAFAWGTGDFCGGLASRHGRAYSVVLVAELVGALILAVMALATGEPWPAAPTAVGAAGAGLVGLVGLASLYLGLASGRMGLVAPLSAMIAAMVPIVAGAIMEGVPHSAQMVGFLFDACGNLFFVLAAQSGRLDVASVIASLYPGMTVLLARVILHERLNRLQTVGVVAALTAVVLIAW